MTIEKLQAQVAELQAQVAALSILALADTPGLDGYYASRYSGEQIDNLLSGLGFEIGGSYANLAAIQAAFPNGDTHAYQAKDTMDIYVWNAKTRAWESVGKLQGPVGEKGDKGDPGGPPGPQGERGPGSNPNLLDNWYFLDPINQRGLNEYNPGRYSIDRWILAGYGNMVVEGHCVKMTREAGDGKWLNFVQVVDSSIRDGLSGKQVTLSALVKGKCGVHIKFNDTYVNQAYNGYIYDLTLVTTTAIAPATPITYSDMTVSTLEADSPVEIYAVKLELGTEQTLARQDADGNWVLNDPPPNKALELAKCQRYYRRFDRIVTNTGGISTPYVSPYLNYPDMRGTPLFQCYGGIVDGGGTPINASIVNSVFTKNSSVIIQLNESFSGNGIVQFLDCVLNAEI